MLSSGRLAADELQRKAQIVRIAIIASDGREALKQYSRLHPDFGTAPDALLQGLACCADIEVHVLSNTQVAMSSPTKLADNIWFHSIVVPRLGWLRTGYQGCIRAVRCKLREIQPDIVHGQGTERDCAISAVFSGFTNVVTVHGNMRLLARVNKTKPLSYGWLAARLETLTIPRASGVVCITRYTQDAVRDLAKRTWLLPNAVNARFFDVTREPDVPPRILCIGHVTYRKNQNALIWALDNLSRKHAFKLVFFGLASEQDTYAQEFFRLVKDRPWCEYAGFTRPEELPAQFRRASAVALPSLEDNCPMVVLEAMSAGVPAMAAKVGGVPELIEEGQTGLFCDPLDGPSMARGIERLLTDPVLSARLSATAKGDALRRFHPNVIARRHLEIYRELLSKYS